MQGKNTLHATKCCRKQRTCCIDCISNRYIADACTAMRTCLHTCLTHVDLK